MDVFSSALTRAAIQVSQRKPGVITMPNRRNIHPMIDGGETMSEDLIPFIAYVRKRPASAEDVQRSYLEISRKGARYQPGVFRDGLVKGLDGSDRISVDGIVSDFHCDSHGVINRIMLSNPVVETPDGTTSAGNHVWLHRDDMASVRSCDVHLGEIMSITGMPHGYDDKHGRHRLGIADWTPTDCKLMYTYVYADGRRVGKAMPRHMVAGLKVFDVDVDGRTHWADGLRLRDELDELDRTSKPLDLWAIER